MRQYVVCVCITLAAVCASAEQSPDCAGPRRVVSIAGDGTLVASAPPVN